MILHHGTTRQRAEAIIRGGPNPRYPEDGIVIPPFGFFMMPPGQTDEVGTPEQHACGKARSKLAEGGPVIPEIDVPDDIAQLAIDFWPTFCFDDGFGLSELLHEWSRLSMRIIAI